MRVMGLISGTSADGIDGVVVDIEGQGYSLTVKVHGGDTLHYSPDLQAAIWRACAGEALSLEALAELDDAIATAFATAAETLIATYGPVDLVASHGQTVFHRPPQRQGVAQTLGFSLQLGRGEAIADRLQLPTASNFRAADLAAGGEGAPLVPPIDAVLLSHPHRHRCVQNIGGIGNVAYLPPSAQLFAQTPPAVMGWDTGPGNSLLDLAVQHLSGEEQAFDAGGQWAAQGTAHLDLVADWLRHPYFQQAPPKSTGRELFGWDFWQTCHGTMTQAQLGAADMLATLTEFTAQSIAQEYRRWLPQLPDEVLVAGGGGRNDHLCDRLRQHLPGVPVQATDTVGIPSDLKEAIAFAVLGFWRYHGFPGNLPAVTGAQAWLVLGDLHVPYASALG
jgi:anhydro-N-acetylmuramic acid kinase